MAYTIAECVNEECDGLTIYEGTECTDCIDPIVEKREDGIRRAREFRAGYYDYNELIGA